MNGGLLTLFVGFGTVNSRHFSVLKPTPKATTRWPNAALEYVAEFGRDNKFVFLCIRRNHVDQCLSYVNRGVFRDIAGVWQWFLSPDYKRLIVDPKPLLKLGYLGRVMWYIFEMEARQEYYKALYDGKFAFIDLDLEIMTQPEGARNLLARLGVSAEPRLASPLNANKAAENRELRNRIAETVSKITFDPREAAQNFVSAGKRLGDT